MLRTLCSLFVVAALAVALRARADVRPSLLDDQTSDAPPVTLELELGLYHDSEDDSAMLSLPLVLSGTYRASEHAVLELDLPFAFFAAMPDRGDGFESFESGNPFVAAYFLYAFPNGYFRAGGGVGLPVANAELGTLNDVGDLGDALREVIPLASAFGARAMWDPWLYMTDRLSFALPIQFESQHDLLLLGGEIAPAYLITIDQRVAPDSQFALQAAASIGARISKTSLGARVQFVWIDQDGSRDQVQTAVAPFVQTAVGESGFVYARFILPLDPPLGVGRDDGEYFWGLYAGGGGRL